MATDAKALWTAFRWGVEGKVDEIASICLFPGR